MTCRHPVLPSPYAMCLVYSSMLSTETLTPADQRTVRPKPADQRTSGRDRTRPSRTSRPHYDLWCCAFSLLRKVRWCGRPVRASYRAALSLDRSIDRVWLVRCRRNRRAPLLPRRASPPRLPPRGCPDLTRIVHVVGRVRGYQEAPDVRVCTHRPGLVSHCADSPDPAGLVHRAGGDHGPTGGELTTGEGVQHAERAGQSEGRAAQVFWQVEAGRQAVLKCRRAVTTRIPQAPSECRRTRSCNSVAGWSAPFGRSITSSAWSRAASAARSCTAVLTAAPFTEVITSSGRRSVVSSRTASTAAPCPISLTGSPSSRAAAAIAESIDQAASSKPPSSKSSMPRRPVSRDRAITEASGSIRWLMISRGVGRSSAR